MKNLRIITIAFSIYLFFTGITQAGTNAFKELFFIDHENLRYVEDEELTQFQVNEIKQNIDQAVKYGVDGYLLFAKETMEAMLTYDFTVGGIGNIGSQAFDKDSEHRETANRLRNALREVTDYAKQKDIRLYFHSNQFIFPDEVLDVIKPVTWGTAVCPGREETWEVYRGKINEFCSMFPGLAGLQITGDETQISVLSCECEKCKDIRFPERVKRMTNATAQVAKQYDMEVQMRTWQRMGELGNPSEMGEGVLDNVYFSIKNTDGDFRIEHGLDKEFLTAAVSERIVCEFDAWREYTGHNYFPCYMGNEWAPRFQFLKEKGIPRVAVRLMWNSNKNPIFDRPWGNYINIYAFLKLSENPDLDGQEILSMFVKDHYPESAHQAAMDLYNYSMDYQRIIYYINGKHYNADHARVQDEDAEGDLEDAQEGRFLTRREDFEIRRQRIGDAYKKAIHLADQLGEEVPQDWIQRLKDGARVEQYVALSSTDKMEMFFLIHQQMNGGNVSEAINQVRQRMEERVQEWKDWDEDSFEYMQGEDVFEHWTLMTSETRQALLNAVEHEFPGADDIEIKTDDDVYDIDGETKDGRDFNLDVTPEGKIVERHLEVEIDELPSSVQTVIQKELNEGGELDSLMHCKNEGEEEYYEVEIDRNDAELQLKISTDGRVLEREWD